MQLGVVGDIHLLFDAIDVEQLDSEGYDAILFVGDLANYSHRGGLEVAERIAALDTRAIVILGNHDTAHVGQMAAEVLEADALIPFLSMGQSARTTAITDALGSAEIAGYSRHRIEGDGPSVDIIAARPLSAGGPRLAFRPHLRERFGVDDLEDSVRKIRALIDESDADEIVFLAHNGPSGLGEGRSDIWGCDFRKSEGDFGDLDLSRAVDHAKRAGKRVRAVVAGHMHHELRGGGMRRWQLEREGVLYVNAARVPRVFERGGRTLRHHVALSIEPERARAREVIRGS